MQFRLWLESDLWDNVPAYTGGDTQDISPEELYKKQSDPQKKLIENIRIGDEAYLKNLKANIEKHGIKRPIQVHQNMQIYDGIHRLLVALELKIPTIQIRFLQR